MDCSKTGDAMALYLEKRIKPAKAASLARHLIKCGSCREEFLAFEDAYALDCGGEAVLNAAPEGFERSVMEKILRLPAHAPLKASRPDVLFRIFWGVCAVLFGTTLGLMYNQEAVASFLAARPALSAAAGAFDAISSVFRGMVESVLDAGSMIGAETAAGSGGSVITLLVVAALAGTMFLLRRDEKSAA
ncbi:MAG: hypothetical protein FWF03_05555 [Defluviitaleaceae bacterium]|nr:hypothetical protein [Defluviitaleaceae bacterium]